MFVLICYSCCLSSFLGYMLFLFLLFSSSLLIFLLLCFLLFVTYAILILVRLFSPSLRVSRLIVLVVVFFPYPSSFSSFVFLPPQVPARTHLKRITMENKTKTSISFSLPLRDLCENVLSTKIVFFFFFGGFLSSTEHVFVGCSWTMF